LKAKRDGNVMNALRMFCEFGKQNLSRYISSLHYVLLLERIDALRSQITQ
jgi:hypothetical protein